MNGEQRAVSLRISALSAVKEVVLVGVLVTACAGRSDPPASSAAPEHAGAYAAEQAARGRDAFRQTCAVCHTTTEFRGRDFAWRWRRQTAWDLYRRMSTTMPLTNPGGLAQQTYADVIAYILSLNDYPAGPADLVATETAMGAILLGLHRGP